MAKRLILKVGEYEGKDENGNPKTKGEYIRLGVILSGENGEFALIDPTINLAGALMKQRIMNAGKDNKGKGDMVMCSIFTDEQQSDQQPAQAAPQAPQGENFSDDIPFMRIADKSLYMI